MQPSIDLTDKVFGRLTVLERDRSAKYTVAMWRCKCQCGELTTVASNKLRTGKTRSCGCLALEINKTRLTTHGKRHTRVYRVWMGMIQRCVNSKEISYKRYGARGITVCDRWMKFEAFFADMGEPPTNEHSLDRIDGSKGYCPDNCRWTDCKTQARNMKTNRLLTFDGRTQCVAEWAEELGIKPKTLYNRLHMGWSVEKTLTTEPRRGSKHIGIPISS